MSIIEKAVDKLSAGSGEQQGVSHGQDATSDICNAVEELKDTNQVLPDRPIDSKHSAERPDLARQINQGPAPSMVLPLDKLKSAGMVTHDAPRSRIAEEYRSIKRPLLMNIAGKGATIIDNANLVMVTSALEGEGKTFSAINLALSIAMEQDKTVLFVDADISKASAGKLLGLPGDLPGLIDVLLDRGKGIEEMLVQTNIPNLRLLPAGQASDHATELLASEAMHSVMLELSQRYSDRVIIFDSPPLLMTTEASVLANLMGQIVFVVAADQTSQAAISEAITHLGEDKIIGMVLNKANRKIGAKHGYGYGYGYGYGKE
ncbi:XrtA-associated tyrosine autokinase [Pseudomonadota bacterium]